MSDVTFANGSAFATLWLSILRPATKGASSLCLHCGRAHDAHECWRDATARRNDDAVWSA